MNHQKSLLSVAGFVVVACASDASNLHGTHPHDMSVEGHEAAARSEDGKAKTHTEKYDESAVRDVERCGIKTDVYGLGACWTDTENPTAWHLERAKSHRDLAAKHRAASEALRDAERRACSGIAAADRDMSPFAHGGDVRQVTEIRETVQGFAGPAKGENVAGATIVMNPVRGLTAEWLQHIVDCHLARGAALGHHVEGMEYCPLSLSGVDANVRSVGNGFAIDVRSKDLATGQEIWKRAQALGDEAPRN